MVVVGLAVAGVAAQQGWGPGIPPTGALTQVATTCTSLETLLYWNRLARVTPAERLRNDRIADAQGNRNPFVDRPEFADLVWYPV